MPARAPLALLLLGLALLGGAAGVVFPPQPTPSPSPDPAGEAASEETAALAQYPLAGGGTGAFATPAPVAAGDGGRAKPWAVLQSLTCSVCPLLSLQT